MVQLLISEYFIYIYISSDYFRSFSMLASSASCGSPLVFKFYFLLCASWLADQLKGMFTISQPDK